MARLLSTIVDGFVKSKDFVSGALGTGWRIARKFGRWILEIDDLVVRGRMTVFELLIQKIRAVKGALAITQASGKVKEIREDDTNYYIQLEDEMSFVANDIIKCQTFSSGQKNYWVIVSDVTNNEVVIPKTEFVNSSLPEVGDELVQFGNTTDITRQSAIYLHADENGEPAIDVLFGINSKTFEGCTKIRLGGDIPGELGKKGFYCENGLIKSVNTSGEVMYMLRPDGSGMMAKGNISWNADGSGSIFNRSIYWDTDGFHFGNGIKLTWDNLPADAKEVLKGSKGDPGDKGDPGNDANLLPWVEEWNSPGNQTEISGEYVISPKMFSGTRDKTTGKLTGVAFGRGVVTVEEDGVKKQKTGIFGLKNGIITFSIDENGNSFYGGEINVNSNFKVNTRGELECTGAKVSGKMSTPFVSGYNTDIWNTVLKDNYNIFANLITAVSQNIFLPYTGMNGVHVVIFNFDPTYSSMLHLDLQVFAPDASYRIPGGGMLDFARINIIDLSGNGVRYIYVPYGKAAELVGVGENDDLYCWKLLSIS